MADPFSIIAGTAGITAICVRVVRYLRDIHTAKATIEDDIAALIHEIEALEAVNNSIHETFGDLLSAPSANPSLGNTADLWKHTGRSVRNCQIVVERLEKLVKEIYGKTGPTVTNMRDGFGKTRRKLSKKDALRQCWDQLSTYQNALQVLLTTITLHNARDFQEVNASSFEDLSRTLQNLDRGLRSQIATLQDSVDSSSEDNARKDLGTLSALRELRESVDSAATVIASVSSNKHFDIPQPVSSIFTGREAVLEDLRRTFITPPGIRRNHQQRRFVIYGIGGSGKTQFCSKFAEDNRDSFWGVFWIDASTSERIQQTFSQIAVTAGVEPNTNAAMHWLSHIEQRWLLIIDDADDPNISLEKYFPKGNRGHILVTTRNPAHKVHGNVGPGFFDFQGLDLDDANHLLLKAVRQPLPWDSACAASASAITKALGFLALAITHAGAVIRDGLCSLKNYLNFYERSWQRIRRVRAASGAATDETVHHMHVYTTWEICYQRIESKGTEAANDAIQLLKTFAFLYCENIRYDIFRRAVENATLEAEQQEKDRQKERDGPKSEQQTWSQSIKTALVTFMLKNRSRPALPTVVRDARQSGSVDECEDRLRLALRELVQMSLIMRNELNDSYSMHPIVHKWARERPGMGTAEQGLWSEVAATLLSASILLPPLGGSTKDEDFNRDLLPHVDYVRSCRESINERISQNLRSLSTAWLVPKTTINPERALIYAKFSLVYAQCGRWNGAEQLQTEVKDYLHKLLGPAHEKTRRITLALSETYWNMGRVAKAAELQRAVLDICNASLGSDHPDTLRVKDRLGMTLWQQGRYTEARALQEEAVKGLTKRLSRNHADTLNAIDNLGRTVAKFWGTDHFKQAYDLHSEAVIGMGEIHGSDHPRTLIAKENLARVAVHLGGDYLQSASDLILEVLEERKKRLGKEHPYTLLAMVNAAIIKSALGELEEAEELILSGLPIAERNLGKEHIGTLFGRCSLASVLIQKRSYPEAEAILVDVTERQKHMSSRRGDYHPDRLGALIELAKCYRLQGKIEDSIRTCDEALEGFANISVQEHPLARDLKATRSEMVEHQRSICRGEEGNPDITSVTPGPYRESHLI